MSIDQSNSLDTNKESTNQDSSMISTTTSLSQLAKYVTQETDIALSTTPMTIDNMKTFMVALARHEIERIVKSITVIEKIENELVYRVNKDIKNMPVDLLTGYLNIINQSLERAMNIVQNVTADKNLIQFIIDNSKKITNITQVNDNRTIVLADQRSREKIRVICTELIGRLNQESLDIDNSGNQK